MAASRQKKFIGHSNNDNTEKGKLTNLLSWCSFKVPPCSAWFSILIVCSKRSLIGKYYNSVDCRLHSPKRWTNQRKNAYPFENHSLNCSWLSNKVGIIKCKRAHSSAILFWIGVPVSSNRFRQLKLSSVFHLILPSQISNELMMRI